MLLRSFEAHGFKSFADKIEMDFGQGITAIVGPNGSGKSNISDAIRWVLGEQSIRNLRGTKTEDVIFAGSSGRRPLGIAEVILKFDNSDGSLPLDFNEVTIARRVFRSGESEYFINKSPCRLKDIHELLSGSGLGRDSMAIIGQNKVDDVLNNKAEDRRLLFEEAAGIAKYKQRKKEALRKLEDTEQNLTRVLDITSEIETQLEPLRESAERTKLYNELHQEVTAYQVTLLLNKLSKAEKMVETAELEQAALTDEEITVNTRLSVSETEKEKITDQLAKIDETISTAEQTVNTSTAELERFDGRVAVLNERISQSKLSEERLMQENSELMKKSSELHNKLEEINKTLNEKTHQQNKYDELLSNKEIEYQNTIGSIQNIDKLLTEGQQKAFGHLQDIVSERNNLHTVERDITALKMRTQHLEKEYADYVEQVNTAKECEKHIAGEKDSLQCVIQQCQEETRRLTMEKQNLVQKLAQNTSEEKSIVNRMNEMTSRLKVLSSMQQEYEGFGRGIKNVLKSDEPWRVKICGAVAEVLQVPDKYITAVEIALGGALQYIITEDDDTAKQAIQYLKTQNMGRVTFLPLNTIKPRQPHSLEIEAARAPGSLGFAADLVECKPGYRKAIEFLLGRTIVAEDINAALRIAKSAAFSVKIVTLEGELINPGGSLTGGSTHRREASFLGRSNEIQVTKKLLQDTRLNAENLNKVILKLRNRLENTSEALATIQQKRQETEIRQAEMIGHADKVRADIDRIHFAIKTIEAELTLNSDEAKQLEDKRVKCENKIIRLESLDHDHKNQVTNWQEQLKQAQLQKENLNSEITNLKINITAVVQEVSSFKNNYQQYEQEKALVDDHLLRLTKELDDTKAKRSAASAEIVEVSDLRAKTEQVKREAEEKRNLTYQEKLSVLASTQKLDGEIKELRRRVQEVQGKLHEMQILLTKYAYEVKNCHEQLREYFNLTLQQARTMHRDGNLEELTAAAERLEHKIAVLGQVNPAAIEEYDKLRERYEFLKRQYEDLVSAKNGLSDIIKNIDHTMSKQFKAAFEQINEYFGDISVRLFGGGKAHLVLLEPQDMLQTGIDIIVQPPGKKQQNLMLLSGGERALTVIALLFAFLTYRPAPFCMVDEIDAPLDEANLQRFCQFLRDYSKNTQFIVITHRKGTMEAADVMHGITMEESGISKLISVKFMNKAG